MFQNKVCILNNQRHFVQIWNYNRYMKVKNTIRILLRNSVKKSLIIIKSLLNFQSIQFCCIIAFIPTYLFPHFFLFLHQPFSSSYSIFYFFFFLPSISLVYFFFFISYNILYFLFHFFLNRYAWSSKDRTYFLPTKFISISNFYFSTIHFFHFFSLLNCIFLFIFLIIIFSSSTFVSCNNFLTFDKISQKKLTHNFSSLDLAG